MKVLLRTALGHLDIFTLTVGACICISYEDPKLGLMVIGSAFGLYLGQKIAILKEKLK